VTTTAHEGVPARSGIAPAYDAARSRLGLVAVLVGLAAVSWWWTTREMQSMDGGPWTELGTVAWFLGVWVVMMAAMMFPSVAPTVALYSKLRHTRALGAPLVFASGYLLVAAAYELTPLKDVCLGKCRTPLGFLIGNWREGLDGAVRMGARHGAWCLGCCWALMASLFALGVMSVVWMAVVAGLIAFEKLMPSRRVATYGTAALLLSLGMLMLMAPHLVPGLTIPKADMTQMSP